MISTDRYATVVPAPGHVVHGILWLLTPRDIAAIDAYEGLAGGLYRQARLCLRVGSRRRSAIAYVGRSRQRGVAHPGYVELVVTAAREWRFPVGYLAALERWKTSRLSPRRAAESGEIA